jgi:hypothetical protein
MKRITAIIAFLLPLMLEAQESTPAWNEINPSVMEAIRENPLRAGVNTCPYEYVPGPETKVPKGYKAFYISHFGRHGSRTNWPEEGTAYEETLQLYNRAAEAGILTPQGDSIRTCIREIIREFAGMGGRLTYRGTREHREIAARMYGRFRKVFRQGERRIRAIASISPRCLVSMAAATGELLSLDPTLDIRWDSGENYMSYMVTDSSPELRSTAVGFQKSYLKAHTPDTAAFIKKVFTDPGRVRQTVGDPVELMRRTFDVAHNQGAMDMDPYIFRCFTTEDLYHYEASISLQQYLRHCNSLDFSDLRLPSVRPLVDDFVDKADECIETGKYVADLRYAHDSQLMAFASLIGLEAEGPQRSIAEAALWPGYLVTPFAANLLAVFYRNKDNDILVKFYYNEREQRILSLPGGPYYKWEEVKSHMKR